MLIKHKPALSEAQVTPKSIYVDRRSFIRQTLAGTLALSGLGLSVSPALAAQAENPSRSAWRQKLASPLATMQKSPYSTTETPAPLKDIQRYNNFYEFGTGKGDPGEHAGGLTIDPWRVVVEGEVEKPGSYMLEDLIKSHLLEERIYRLRCVEAWSMVIPWVGIPLSALIARFKPTSRARYVLFESLVRPEEMPGQRSLFSGIDWPYQEGLRIDEAMHPLTLMAVGLYGDILPNQNGAPFRLVVPWKYGFKSIKSIVKIGFVETMPPTTWNQLQPGEYGFYANVNPAVDHPRWSQKTERRLPGGLFGANRIETMPFNGYAEEVASLYAGMDLSANY